MTAAEHAIPGSTKSNAGSPFAAPGPTIPPSRTRHLIGNLEAPPLENWEAEAKTPVSWCTARTGRRIIGAWKVARRTIVLDANVLLDKNLSVFL